MNTFGILFKISIFGESHGAVVGITIDNCPAGIPLYPELFLPDLTRRKSGRKGSTPRIEDDTPEIISGVFNGYSTGAPITIVFENGNTISKDYSNLKDTPRPSHADFTAKVKFNGYNDYRGGGHFSGRLTLPLVAAGVIAKAICKNITINAELIEAGGLSDIESAIEQAIRDEDSIGGIVQCRVNGITAGLGEPFFDSVESLISHMVFAIPAIKGIQFGSGFEAAKSTGIRNNDVFIDESGKTASNNEGGINGGITNGNELIFKVAVKPTSSVSKPQRTFNMANSQSEVLEIKGRHDVCIALRVPVVVEAVTAIVLADLILRNHE
ncbi:MAG: chorismate synthase [Bacteroidota bacterium]